MVQATSRTQNSAAQKRREKVNGGLADEVGCVKGTANASNVCWLECWRSDARDT